MLVIVICYCNANKDHSARVSPPAVEPSLNNETVEHAVRFDRACHMFVWCF